MWGIWIFKIRSSFLHPLSWTFQQFSQWLGVTPGRASNSLAIISQTLSTNFLSLLHPQVSDIFYKFKNNNVPLGFHIYSSSWLSAFAGSSWKTKNSDKYEIHYKLPAKRYLQYFINIYVFFSHILDNYYFVFIHLNLMLSLIYVIFTDTKQNFNHGIMKFVHWIERDINDNVLELHKNVRGV